MIHQTQYLHMEISIYLVFSSLEIKRRHIQTKVYYQLFYSVWKEASYKPWKVALAKKSFPSEYIMDTNCFDECFLFRVITGRNYFLYKLIVTHRFGVTVMLLRSLKQVFWKKSVFYVHYLHNNIAMLLIPQRSKIRCPDNCPPDNFPQGVRTIVPEEICTPDNCFREKLPPRTISIEE